MDTVKVMHCADLHLGSKMSFLGKAADILQSELVLSFERIIALCKSSGTELLIISGDLFDGFDIPEHMINRICEMFRSIPDTTVAICAGNHDPLCGNSPLECADLPRNVILFGDKLSAVEIKEKNLRLFGQSFKSVYYEGGNPLKISVPDDDMINILVIHADLGGAENSRYNPISVADIAESRMDYVALGHIHKRSYILSAGGTYYAYPGCAQGTGFDESGQKGVYSGKIGKGYCDMEFIPLSQRIFAVEKIDVTDCNTNSEITAKAATEISRIYGDKSDANLYKIILTGNLPANFTPDTAYITAALESKYFYIKVKDHTKLKFNLNELAEQNSLKGIFVKKLLEKQQNDPDNHEIYELALNLGLKAFEGEVKQDDD